VLGRAAVETDAGWRIALDDSELRFVAARDGRGEGLAVFDVVVRDPDAVRVKARALGNLDDQGDVVLCGTRVRLIQA
jgi:hypothetical protein